ncbi:MAG: DUF2007 domain-containing protein [Gammaproteobacteria bacterium]|nr:DUF2007 domain-containing protein [Gammaproteobacteria bacterium]MDH3412783.1 DUF2007 domain-containing protein [Gammaproteobacteria bacterium]
MKRVYSSDNPLIVGHLKQVLEANHIACMTRNEYLLGGAGEIPPIECWPEIWVVEDFQQERARALVESVLALGAEAGANWHCCRCGEALEGQFTACWACGADRPPDD